MLIIQSATAEIRHGKKEEEERKKRKKPQGKNMIACPIPYGSHKYRRVQDLDAK